MSRKRVAGSTLLGGVAIAALLGSSLVPAGAAIFADTDIVVTDDFTTSSGSLGEGWMPYRGSWELDSGRLVSPGDETTVKERLVVKPDLELGSSYSTEMVFDITSYGSFSYWNGLAVNVQDDPAGGLQFYLARVVPSASGTEAKLQVLQVSQFGLATQSLTVLYTKTLSADQAAGPLELQIVSPENSPNLGVTLTDATGVSASNPSTIVKPTGQELTGGGVGIYSLAGSISVRKVEIDTSGEQDAFVDDFARSGPVIGNGWSALGGSWQLPSSGIVTSPGLPATGENRVLAADVSLEETYRVTARLEYQDSGSYPAWNGVVTDLQPDPDGGTRFYLTRAVPRGTTEMDLQTLLVTQYGTTGQTIRLLVTNRVAVAASGTVEISVARLQDWQSLATTVRSSSGEATRRVIVPDDALIQGGSAGLYSLGGYVQFTGFSMTTTTSEAGAITAVPELVCTAPTGGSYDLPVTEYEVAEVSEVGTSWSGHPVPQAIRTVGTTQYIGYYDADRQLVVASRDTGSDVWTSQVLDTTVGWDSHNSITLEVDSAGQLHVSANMHNDPLNYWRTTVAGDVTSLTRYSTMVDPVPEALVTYPEFFTTPSGELIFSYRTGYSGSGTDYYYHYDTTTQTWSSLLSEPLLDGEGVRNAYSVGPVVGPDGRFHLVWTWRETADAATNHDVYYAVSDDLINWEKADGTPLTLPLQMGDGDLVADVPINDGLLNGWTRIGFDADGNALVVYSHHDDDHNQQLYLARHDGTSWQNSVVTNWTGRAELLGGGSLTLPFNLLAVNTLSNGDIEIQYRCNDDLESLVLDGTTFAPLGAAATPSIYPETFLVPESTFPNITVQHRDDVVLPDGSRYVLRWESLPGNQDQPWASYPDAQPIRVYLISPVCGGP
ncbi:MAG: BNR repeat-containing protein [Protaetiibacter sp.]